MKHKQYCCKVPETVNLPAHIFERANLQGNVSLEIMNGTIVALREGMTVLEILETIENLETKVWELHQILKENFLSAEDCENCNFCGSFLDDTGENPFWMEHLKDEDGEIILDQENIADLSPRMIERLCDLGLCFDDINFAMMEKEVFFF